MRHANRVALAILLAMAWGGSDARAQQTTIGLRGGISVASASFDDDTFDKSNRTGFVGGAFADFDLGMLGLQVAGLYNSKGVKTNVGELDLRYVEIPAVIKLGLPLAIVKPSVFGGAAVAFRTGCKIAGVECADGAFESRDFLAVVGADVAIHLGSISFWGDARYDIGLSDIHDANDVFGDIKNRNWNLTAGVGFRP